MTDKAKRTGGSKMTDKAKRKEAEDTRYLALYDELLQRAVSAGRHSTDEELQDIIDTYEFIERKEREVRDALATARPSSSRRRSPVRPLSTFF